MIAPDALHHLPLQERIRVMEALWADLTPAAAGLPVPPWQREVLDEREAQVAEARRGTWTGKSRNGKSRMR